MSGDSPILHLAQLSTPRHGALKTLVVCTGGQDSGIGSRVAAKVCGSSHCSFVPWLEPHCL